MRERWEKFNFSWQDSEYLFLTIDSSLSLRRFKNIFGFEFDFSDADLNLVCIVEKRSRSIFGFFKWKLSETGEPVIAKENFDVFTFERLDIACLEILQIRLGEQAFHRLSFRQSLSAAVGMLLNDVGVEAAMVHLCEQVVSIESATKQIINWPMKSPIICCEVKEKSEGPASGRGAAEHSQADRNLFSMVFDTLTKLGFEIWSEPKVDPRKNEIYFLLGLIGDSAVAEQSKAFSLFREAFGRQVNVTF